MKDLIRGLIAVAAIGLFIVGCTKKEENHIHHAPNGDLQETTKSADTLPAFLNGKREDIRLVYRLAAENSDLLQSIPCYCGCGVSAGHRNNQNCFIAAVNKDGSVAWDDHGTRCDVCLKIAAQSVKMKQEGKTVKEIRQFIDNAYKKGYAKPTDTPLPV